MDPNDQKYSLSKMIKKAAFYFVFAKIVKDGGVIFESSAAAVDNTAAASDLVFLFLFGFENSTGKSRGFGAK